MPFPLYRLAALVSVCLAAAGCSPEVVERKADPTTERLQSVFEAHATALTANGRLPRSVAELRPYLEKAGNPDELLKSPADGQPFVILWGFDPNEAIPLDENRPGVNRVFIHEKEGKDGYVHAAFVDGTICKLTRADFDKAPKANP